MGTYQVSESRMNDGRAPRTFGDLPWGSKDCYLCTYGGNSVLFMKLKNNEGGFNAIDFNKLTPIAVPNNTVVEFVGKVKLLFDIA